jgi:hypothetical protein
MAHDRHRNKNENWEKLFEELERETTAYAQSLDKVSQDKRDALWRQKRLFVGALQSKVLNLQPDARADRSVAMKQKVRILKELLEQYQTETGVTHAGVDFDIGDANQAGAFGERVHISALNQRRGHRAESKFWQLIDRLLAKLGLLHLAVGGAKLSGKLHLFAKKAAKAEQMDLADLRKRVEADLKEKEGSGDANLKEKERDAVFRISRIIAHLTDISLDPPTYRFVAATTIIDAAKSKLVGLMRDVPSWSESQLPLAGIGSRPTVLADLLNVLSVKALKHFEDDRDIKTIFKESITSPEEFRVLFHKIHTGGKDYKDVIFQLIVNSRPHDWMQLITAKGALADNFTTAIYYATPTQRAMIVKAVLQDAPDTLFELAKASAAHHEKSHQDFNLQPGDQLMKTHQPAHWLGVMLSMFTAEEVQAHSKQLEVLLSKHIQQTDNDLFITGLRSGLSEPGTGKSKEGIEDIIRPILDKVFASARPSSLR